MSLFTLYLIFVVVPSLASWVGFLAFICGAGIIVCGVIIASYMPSYRDDDKEKTANFQKLVKKFFIGLMITGSVLVFIPNDHQIYTVVGAYAVTNNENVMKLPDNIAKAANAYLEKLTEQDEKKK